MNWPITPITQALPGKNEVVCWRVLLDRLNNAQFISLYELLSLREKNRADAFIKPIDKNRFVAAHGILSLLSKQIMGTNAQIVLNEYGKPHFLDSDLQFNISHSGNIILLAFAINAPIGVDVEEEREIDNLECLAKNYFHQDEILSLEGLDAGALSKAFFSCWSKKEAVIKALGLGLSLPLNSFRVTLKPIFGDWELELASQFPQSWTLKAFEPQKGYFAAIAAASRGMQVRFYDFDNAAMQ